MNFVECTGIITDLQIRLMIIYRREFSVMSVAFSNRRVTHLRYLIAQDGLVLFENTVWWFMRQVIVPTKSELVSEDSKIVSVESKIVSMEFERVSMKSRSVSK
jgi:hypothetical protein